MGFFDWFRRRDSGDTTEVTVRGLDASADLQRNGGPDVGGDADLRSADQHEMVDQIDHLVHGILAAGAGKGGSGGVFVTSSTNVVVDGQVVDPDDPRAREAMGAAAAKLRAQGFDELAADLERQSGAAPATAAPPPAAAPAGEDRTASPAPPAAAPPFGADEPEGELGEAPSAPPPPSPPPSPELDDLGRTDVR